MVRTLVFLLSRLPDRAGCSFRRRTGMEVSIVTADARGCTWIVQDRVIQLLSNAETVMTLTIDVPPTVEERLAQKAKDAGLDVVSYVARIVEAHAQRPSLRELSGDVYDQFLA